MVQDGLDDEAARVVSPSTAALILIASAYALDLFSSKDIFPLL